ncbi:ATP-binding protein [Nonomuraea sp. NPDC005983]|uniref:AlbA family DNA-binding domain-containing protein n=1 Tax=Nonomuraea sp. NPDC005983 TaxID=3155595 RepID=UPI0033A41991
MLYSPRRLEALLGTSLHLVTYQQIKALVGNTDAREAEDLDYKRAYSSGDKERSEKGNDDIAIDIATFANHRGGLIIVGMAEVQEIPSAVLDIEFGTLESRIRQAAASRIHPMPRFETRPVRNPDDPTKGVLLISIAPSSYAPHAVSTPAKKETGLRWPRRHGADKVWLSESEIAAAYRRRVMAATDQAQRILDLENRIVTTTALTSGQYPLPLLVVTLVPDLPGELILDGNSVERIRAATREEIVMLGAFTPTFEDIGVAHRRLIAEAGAGTPYAIRAELHIDGAGTFAVHPIGMSPAAGDNFKVGVLDAEIVIRTASALRYLARHARDRAGANGSALVRVTLVADTYLHPAVLPAESTGAWPYDNPNFVRYRVHLHTSTKIVGADRPVGIRAARLA